MLPFGVILRAIVAAVVIATLPVAAVAQQTLKIFDAHLHYNQEPNPFYPLERVLDVFRRNNVAGILANSRPNKGTHQLVDARAAGLWVVPFIRPYRTRDDVQNWSTDPAIYDLIETEYKRGYFRGVGEFHIYGEAAQRQLVKQVVDFAAERNLYLLAHCDEAALSILLAHNRRARIIWAHTGFSTPTGRVRELLETHPELMGELLPRRAHRRRRQACRRVARAIRPSFRPLPARLRHMDQRALVWLRHHHADLSRLARAASRSAGEAHRPWQCRALVRR
jgi:hypothetical protein